jgi:hypothetical protein
MQKAHLDWLGKYNGVLADKLAKNYAISAQLSDAVTSIPTPQLPGVIRR